jgi:two-component system chemotaxis response regulator CheB
MIRVLIAEDSAATREYLVYLLGQDPAMEVVGTARNGEEAVAQTERLRPHVILMDVHMPRMNGYEATRKIMERAPTPIVICSASLHRDEVGMSFAALQAGALAVVQKPVGLEHPDQAETARRLVETMKLMAEVKVVRRFPRGRDGMADRKLQIADRKLGIANAARGEPDSRSANYNLKCEIGQSPAPKLRIAAASSRRIRLVAIGASTGGPQVLVEILRTLPEIFGAPILLVQHIAVGFAPGLVEWLGQQTPLTVKLAQAEESTYPGTVYVAPDGMQMGVTRDGQIRLTKEAAEDGFCPSASFLFQSVAEAYGRSGMGILLTGMGRDGALGLQRLREVGGVTIAQDKESSVVFGMPGEAIRLGAAEHVLSPDQIAEFIRSSVT